MFGQIPLIEREGSFGRIGARIHGTQHTGCHISESYKGTLHLSDHSFHCIYQPCCEGCDGAYVPHEILEHVLIQ